MINNQWNFNGNTYSLITQQDFSKIAVPYMTDFTISNCITQKLMVRRSNVSGIFFGEWKEVIVEHIHLGNNTALSKQAETYKGKCYYEAIKNFGMPPEQTRE